MLHNDITYTFTISDCYFLYIHFFFVLLNYRSYHFDDNVSTSINSDDSQQTNGFRRVLPQMLAVAVKNLVLFGEFYE